MTAQQTDSDAKTTWFSFYSHRLGREYYYDPVSGKTTWVVPSEDEDFVSRLPGSPSDDPNEGFFKGRILPIITQPKNAIAMFLLNVLLLSIWFQMDRTSSITNDYDVSSTPAFKQPPILHTSALVNDGHAAAPTAMKNSAGAISVVNDDIPEPASSDEIPVVATTDEAVKVATTDTSPQIHEEPPLEEPFAVEADGSKTEDYDDVSGDVKYTTTTTKCSDREEIEFTSTSNVSSSLDHDDDDAKETATSSEGIIVEESDDASSGGTQIEGDVHNISEEQEPLVADDAENVDFELPLNTKAMQTDTEIIDDTKVVDRKSLPGEEGIAAVADERTSTMINSDSEVEDMTELRADMIVDDISEEVDSSVGGEDMDEASTKEIDSSDDVNEKISEIAKKISLALLAGHTILEKVVLEAKSAGYPIDLEPGEFEPILQPLKDEGETKRALGCNFPLAGAFLEHCRAKKGSEEPLSRRS